MSTILAAYEQLGPLASFLLGLIWGSFFNVCIFRIPVGESVVRHGSRCPRCATPIRWFHNIPVVSYVFLRGKCSSCGSRISVQYPLVELATGLLFLALFFKYGWSWKFGAYALFVSDLLVISVIDLHHRIIPDELSLSGIVLGFLACFLTKEISWSDSLLGIALGGGTFWAIAWLYERWAKREGLGGGDVKLLAMIGAWLGYKSILVIIIISSALGSIIGIGLMLVKRKDFKFAIPFGPFLAFAAVVFVFWGAPLQALIFPEFS